MMCIPSGSLASSTRRRRRNGDPVPRLLLRPIRGGAALVDLRRGTAVRTGLQAPFLPRRPRRAPPDTRAGALRHFAAGILPCSIGTELLPALDLATGTRENAAACGVIFVGVAIMMIVRRRRSPPKRRNGR